MSEADEAYKAAAREIARVRAEGGTSLRLLGDRFGALERLPDEIANWTELQRLNLSDTQIADSGLAHVAGLTGLQSLNLWDTQITDAGLAHVAGLAALQSLYLWGTQITDAGLAHVAGLTGLQVLFLSRTQITDAGLAHVAGLTGLQGLYLSGTQITDAGLAQVAGLTGLQFLDLSHTQISDAGLAHMAGLTGLQGLFLSRTQITDAGLAHVAGLTGLQSLDLRNTQVRDLRPICDLPIDKLGNALLGAFGLQFADIPAAELDETLGELAGIADHKDRTEKTLAYLRGLPRWPASLPWLQQEEIPSGKPAPLQVTERDGKLVALRSATELSDESDRMAALAWAALRDFLEDLADQRGRIHNMMPNLARALTRFEAALSTRFDLCDPIALGIHGERVIGLAPNGAEYLNSADATDVAKFAAAIALFLERFPAWRAYRDDAKPPVYSKQDIADVIPLIRALDEKLRDYPEIDPEIPKQLDGLADAVADAPDEKLAVRGMFDSLGNVLSALAIKTLNVIKFVGKQSAKMTWAATKSVLDKSTDVALNLAATDYFLNNADNLTKLAAKLPAIFEWVAKFLSTLPF